MASLIINLKNDLPQAFTTEAYRETVKEIKQTLEQEKEGRMQQLQQAAREQGFGLIRTASGLMMAPVQEGKVMSQEAYSELDINLQQKLDDIEQQLGEQLNDVLLSFRKLELDSRQEIEGLNLHVAEAAIEHHFAVLQEQYQVQDEILLYLNEVHDDVLNRLHDFDVDEETEHEVDWRRYEVNLFVDHRHAQGAPVIIEDNPTYHNVMGRIEYEMRYGAMSTHFTNIKAGSLHRANGGYLVLDMRDIMPHFQAWEALKRTLKGGKIVLQAQDGGQLVTKSLDPEAIPLDVKVILLGNSGMYYHLYEADEDFSDLFKVKADFSSWMPRDNEHETEYARFVANRCREEKLFHFDPTAVAKVIEFGSWLCEHQHKLSTRFGAVADLVREASYWAGRNGRSTTTATDVQQALAERIHRANSIEEYIRAQIAERSLFITVSGKTVGQVNGLSVIDLGDHAFGQPGRITARTFMGDQGVVNIEREVDMAGPLHNKGLLILMGYLGGKYAQDQPLSLSASLTFEQNYSSIDGDSASSTELYVLLSSLSGLPIKQGIAVTGSVDQYGDIQPIGGASEKIEGFFAVCRLLGLTGEQGVMIPAANVLNLMLHEDVVTAVAAGEFNIWPVQTIDEGLEILMDTPAGIRNEQGEYSKGTVHQAVQERLLALAKNLKTFGHGDDLVENEDEDNANEPAPQPDSED